MPSMHTIRMVTDSFLTNFRLANDYITQLHLFPQGQLKVQSLADGQDTAHAQVRVIERGAADKGSRTEINLGRHIQDTQV